MELPFVIHPMLVHFPIAFYLLEFFLLLLAVWKKDPAYEKSAGIVFALAFLGTLAAIGSGFIDAGGWDGIAGKVRPHAISAAVTFVLQIPRGLYWKFSKPRKISVLWISGALVYALIVWTAYLGGEMVYGE